MQSFHKNNLIYKGSEGRESLIDIEIPQDFNNKLILFVHGFMGFKDWGCWNLMQSYFAKNQFGFCKYNVSHNGLTLENKSDFVDLEAFSLNTYSKERFDLKAVLDWLETQFETLPEIHLIGHSRGGGIALLGAQDSRIHSVITLAAISSISIRFPLGDELESWKKEGVRYTRNSRTGQNLPHNIIMFEDFQQNMQHLDIEKQCSSLKKRALIIHGAKDQSVPIHEGEQIASWLGVPLTTIHDADHTFGSSEPWNQNSLPEQLEIACRKILEFLNCLS